MSNLDDFLKIANKIVNDVSKFLVDDFGAKKEMTHKTQSHFGIKNDLIANKMYEDYFKAKTPEISLYTEEGDKNLNHGYVWVIDPIEGTSNYRAGNPFWATQISLLNNSVPVLSIVNAPFLKMKFTAIKNKGAFLNSKKISVSSEENLDRALVDFGRGTKDSDKDWFSIVLSKLIKKIRTNRTFGACGLDIAMCAAGITDAYINLGSEIYDYLPASLLVSESGGNIVNFKGEKWTINDPDFLCGNTKIVSDILKLI